LLTFPTAFDNAAWTKTRSSISANAAVAPDGTTTADKLVEDTSVSLDHRINQVFTAVVGSSYVYSVYAKAAERSQITLFESASGTTRAVLFDLTAGTSTPYLGSGLSADIVSVGSGWYRCSIFVPNISNASGVLAYMALASGGLINYTGDGTSGVLFWGAQLETGTTASAFQNIGTDKMTVFAGVRKLSDAGNGTVLETSAAADSNNGAFFLRAPSGGLANYQFASRGTSVASLAAFGFTSPITNVVTSTSDISSDNITIRADGTQVATSSTDQGTGTYGNYPLFIGARNSASLFFSGHLYSLIVRGAQSNTGQISSTETWVASRTGITI
jgi:hypothetical protein